MNRVLPIMIVAIFLASMFYIPIGVTPTSPYLHEEALSTEILQTYSQIASGPLTRESRVAVYDELNVSLPDYATGGTPTNGINDVISILTDAGYHVDKLTLDDIQNHELCTRDYDVFVMVNNLPRENITYYVKEYWLGGGGILGFGLAAGYMSYFGHLGPYYEGDFGQLYVSGDPVWGAFSINTPDVLARHPTAKQYHVGDTIPYSISSMTVINTDIELNVNNSATTVIRDSTDLGLAIAIDNDVRGGRQVLLAGNGTNLSSDFDSVIVDSIDWLTPRPKGRILFDVSHFPLYPVDTWDPTGYTSAPRFTPLRETLVNKTYTFDKLWPSASGNFTSDNLAGYDMLIINTPEFNFSASEVTAISNWVAAGGGLIVFGENTGFLEENQNINYLLSSYDLWMNLTEPYASFGFATTEIESHPSTEGVSEFYFSGGCYVNYTGLAYPLCNDTGNAVIAAQDVGQGRIILAGDVNFLANFIELSDNRVASVSLINWLTAAQASVLLYTDATDAMVNADYNFYTSPACRALNELGLKYLMSNSIVHFNISLNSEDWDLVILDQNYLGWSNDYYHDVRTFIEGGGRFIGRSWDHDFGDVLGPYLGVDHNGSLLSLGPPSIYLWDDGHEIFNIPNDYGADNISTSNNDFNTDYRFYEPFANATSIAGLSPTQVGNESSIILSNVLPTIVNAFSISQYFDDTDDSTYGDGYEIWMNEIAYLMRPEIDSPPDKTIEYGSTGETITWNPSSHDPWRYTIDRDSVEITDTQWNGGSISVLLDGYSLGTYTFDVTVYDSAGESATDTLVVMVEDTTSPALVSSPANLEYQEGVTEHLLNWSFTELLPDSYWLLIDNDTIESGAWNGSEISVDVGGFVEGAYNVTIAVNDTSGNWFSDQVTLTVTEAPTTTTTETTTTTTSDTEPTTTTTTTPDDGNLTLIIIIAVVGVAILIVIVIIMRKRQS